MTAVVYVPRDSSAVSLGADAAAEAIRKEAASRGRDLKIVRNGSRGMFSLEPMVEVATSGGRIAYGPVAAREVATLFDSGVARRLHRAWWIPRPRTSSGDRR
jgi:formate dehydrogenase iron-sulfur subunit